MWVPLFHVKHRKGSRMTDRDRTAAAVNAARTEMRAALDQLPTLAAGVPLAPGDYQAALWNAEYIAHSALKYVRYLSALATRDGAEDV